MVTPLRQYEVGQFYHIYSRGNRKQPIFFDQYDRQRFIDHFLEYRALHPVTTLAYTLMTNHFHFLVVLEELDALTKLFGKLLTSHSKFINTKYELTGSLFESRFQTKRIVDEPHLLHLSRYIHRNILDLLGSTRGVEPETLLTMMAGYRWSSLGEVLGLQPSSVVDREQLFTLSGTSDARAYRAFMLEDLRDHLARRAIEQTSRLDPRG
jgi:REP element-mobilizing transposase RayT